MSSDAITSLVAFRRSETRCRKGCGCINDDPGGSAWTTATLSGFMKAQSQMHKTYRLHLDRTAYPSSLRAVLLTSSIAGSSFWYWSTDSIPATKPGWKRQMITSLLAPWWEVIPESGMGDEWEV